MGFMSKLFGGNEDSVSKVSKASSKVESALALFKKASDEIDRANTILDEAKNEDVQTKEMLLQRIKDVDSNMTKADKEKEANLKLKEKLSEFVR